jgi:hypothetical protein
VNGAVATALSGGGHLPGPGTEFPHVLAGVKLDGSAARLAGQLDPGFLAEAGWDPEGRVLAPRRGHPLLRRPICRALAAGPPALTG